MMDNVPVMTNGIVYNNVRVTKRVPIRKESPQLNLLNLWNVKVFGSLPEWLNGTVLKTVILERVSGVRIPELPPGRLFCVLCMRKPLRRNKITVIRAITPFYGLWDNPGLVPYRRSFQTLNMKLKR